MFPKRFFSKKDFSLFAEFLLIAMSFIAVFAIN
jgi:hypothetical protein